MTQTSPTATPLSLAELSAGETSVIVGFRDTSSQAQRLREMGLMQGTKVTYIRSAPLGDPIEIELRGYKLSLRREEAAHILVQRENAS